MKYQKIICAGAVCSIPFHAIFEHNVSYPEYCVVSQNVHSLPNVNVKQTTTPIYFGWIYGEFMKWSRNQSKTRWAWKQANKTEKQRKKKCPTNKYQLQHTILLCTCFACNFYQKANRVIAVNELYVLLSDQTVNVTHPHWERASEWASKQTNEWTNAQASERDPEYFSRIYSAQILNILPKIYFDRSAHIKRIRLHYPNLIAFTGNWSGGGGDNADQVQINNKLLQW